VHVLQERGRGYGTEKRVILLHGPVGSSKSTIARLLKQGRRGLLAHADGALYTFDWVNLEGTGKKRGHALAREGVYAELGGCERLPHHRHRRPRPGEPLHLPRTKYEGDWAKVVEHVRVRRLILSEKDRVGIGTFQPKDEKNQDSTELTGDINYRKIAEYGSDSDPRAFNFDGEFNIANRGMIEFIEVLKLDVAFLYDLLGASQEHKIKPKKFAQTDIDEVIIGHTNEPEYKKLQNNEFMEALRDRTVKIDIPYITKLTEEIRIYEKDFNPSGRSSGKHIAPHTLEIAAMWAVLTRLEEPKKHNLTLCRS
jgi:serine protein kinase